MEICSIHIDLEICQIYVSNIILCITKKCEQIIHHIQFHTSHKKICHLQNYMNDTDQL